MAASLMQYLQSLKAHAVLKSPYKTNVVVVVVAATLTMSKLASTIKGVVEDYSAED